MRNKGIIVLVLFGIIALSSLLLFAKATQIEKNPTSQEPPVPSFWKQIDTGLYFTEIQGPAVTEIGDYKVQIIRIDPKYYSFDFVLASKYDSCRLTAPEWAEKGKLIGVINAGMYNTGNRITSSGLLIDNQHINQGQFRESFRMMVAFNPTKSGLPEFRILDLATNNWDDVKTDYSSYCQSIRLIDENGNAVYWHPKRKMRMSIAALGVDDQGNALFLFSRSPYSANEFIKFMLNLPFKVQSAMYLEGGPQASLFVEHNQFCLDKVGSYVSPGYAHDRNDHFWEIPNMIGFRKK